MNLRWKERAACREMPGVEWDGELTDVLFETCMGCSVKADCLMEALGREERSDPGVWGGTSPEQRRLIRKGADPYQVWRNTAEEMMPL